MKTEIVTVLGMHHSGTSCLTECLLRAGLPFGDNVRPDTCEDRRVIKLHAQLVDWMNPHESVSPIPEFYGPGRWGMKEPLTLFTYRSWQRVAEMIPVGTFRHPRRVLGRLTRVYGGDYAKGDALWRRYNTRLLELYDEFKFPLVCFDDDSEQYGRSVRKALEHVGLRGPTLFDLSKRKSVARPWISISKESEELYTELKARQNGTRVDCGN